MITLTSTYRQQIFRAACAALIGAAVSGCFTGIESTPRISDSDVRRQNIQATAEDSYLNDVIPAKSNSSTEGHQWIVTDSKIKLVLDPSAAGFTFNPGDTLTLVGVADSRAFDGQRVADISLKNAEGNQFIYRSTSSAADIAAGGGIDIPFTVSRQLVDNVREKMLGKTYYITTTSRYDMSGNVYTGRRFVPVRVDSVYQGNTYYPVSLQLTDDRDEHFRLYMSVDSASKMPRKFASMFSLTDPRLRYPAISNENWQRIVEGRVAQGMTRDECRLALGKPDNVDRQTGYSVVREIWVYENGRYLMFEDGVLETFRQ